MEYILWRRKYEANH